MRIEPRPSQTTVVCFIHSTKAQSLIKISILKVFSLTSSSRCRLCNHFKVRRAMCGAKSWHLSSKRWQNLNLEPIDRVSSAAHTRQRANTMKLILAYVKYKFWVALKLWLGLLQWWMHPWHVWTWIDCKVWWSNVKPKTLMSCPHYSPPITCHWYSFIDEF